MPKPFRFELDQPVVIEVSEEHAKVIGRAQYTNNQPDQYQLCYVNAAGVATEQWWEDSTLRAA